LNLLRFAILLSVLLLGTAASASAKAPRVGHKVEQIVVPGSAAGEPRKVMVHLWYPADKRAFVRAPKTGYSSALRSLPLGPQWDPLSWKIEAEIARETDALDRRGGPFPVIVFTHGSTNDPIDYAHTLERIAGEGFVVAAPYHVNNTQDDVRIDFANAQFGLNLACADGRPSPCARTDVARGMEDRVRDISRILDSLPSWLAGGADSSRVGVLGHSRGSATALAAAGGSSTWGFPGERRVKAVMGLAISTREITFAVDLQNVTIPVLLVAGGRDRLTPQAISEEAFTAIASREKTFVAIPDATHRSFDSTYCAQMQAAGAVFDADHDGVVDAAELSGTGPVLDRHTLTLIVAAPPNGASGKAVHYCASRRFTRPVDIRSLVGSIAGSELPPVVEPGGVCNRASFPCTGLDTDDVKRRTCQLAARFFNAKLGRRHIGRHHFDDHRGRRCGDRRRAE
jgi:predicted dienelactone hydrolase